jgi:hypothetical protein
LVTFIDRNEPRSAGKSGEAIPFTSPEDLMKNLPKVMSNMLGAGGGMPGNSPTFKITMIEYEDMAIKVGDRLKWKLKRQTAVEFRSQKINRKIRQDKT